MRWATGSGTPPPAPSDGTSHPRNRNRPPPLQSPPSACGLEPRDPHMGHPGGSECSARPGNGGFITFARAMHIPFSDALGGFLVVSQGYERHHFCKRDPTTGVRILRVRVGGACPRRSSSGTRTSASRTAPSATGSTGTPRSGALPSPLLTAHFPRGSTKAPFTSPRSNTRVWGRLIIVVNCFL